MRDEGRLRAFPHALPLPAPQRDGVSPHSLPPCPPVQRVPLPSGRSRHFTLSLRRVYVAAISDVQASQRSGGPLSVISSRAFHLLVIPVKRWDLTNDEMAEVLQSSGLLDGLDALSPERPAE